MKKIVNLLTCLIFTFSALSQNIKQDLLNRYFEVTTEEKKAFFYRLSQAYNGFWAYTDYDSKNRIVRSGFFTDSFFITPIGQHAFYWEGKPVYKGRYVDGRPSGYWYF